jgi:RNA polymerase sigma-70 factor, ECF subfamily
MRSLVLKDEQKQPLPAPIAGLGLRAEEWQLPTSRRITNSSLMEIIRLAHGGNAAAFEFLYRWHRQHVYALCLRMVRDPAEAEDLAQETFLQVFRKMHTFRGEAAFSSWLYRLTTNCVLMSFRRKSLIPASLDEIAQAQQHGEFEEMARPDLHLCGLLDRLNLQAAVDLLPGGCKAAFILHDVEGYKHREVATMLGCSIAGSKSQLHRARKRLRELLRHQRLGEPRRHVGPRNQASALAC